MIKQTEVLYRTNDLVEHPAHYTHGGLECWDVIREWKLGYFDGNVIKYICRAKHKGDALEDYRKAARYLEKLIEIVREEEVRG